MCDFFLSVLQIDYPELVESTTQRTIRVESRRFDHFSYPPSSPCCVIFLSVLQIDFPVSRIDNTKDDSSRIETSRHYLRRIESVWVYWTTLLVLHSLIANTSKKRLILKFVGKALRSPLTSLLHSGHKMVPRIPLVL